MLYNSNYFVELVLQVFLEAAIFLPRLDVFVSRTTKESSLDLPGMGFVRKTLDFHPESGVRQTCNQQTDVVQLSRITAVSTAAKTQSNP